MIPSISNLKKCQTRKDIVEWRDSYFSLKYKDMEYNFEDLGVYIPQDCGIVIFVKLTDIWAD